MYKNDNLDDNDKAYCEKVLRIIKEHDSDFSALLDKHSLSFPEKRIYPADRSILLIALAEILYMDDIPDKVSVNEAANIASKYSSEKSASFITGILSSIIGGKDNV
jgi:N utilization substance protein B